MTRFLIALMSMIGVRSGLSADQRHDASVAALQSAPGVGAAVAAEAVGFASSNWVVISSVGFIIMQAAYLAWKWRRDARREAERVMDRQEDRAAGRRTRQVDSSIEDN
jgi:hypothetical protein